MKKELLFKNSTKYSKKLYDEFTRFHNHKNALSYDLFTIFILILLIYCIITTIKAKIVFLSIIFIIMLTLFIVYRFFKPIHLYKKEVKKTAITREKVFNFYFYDTYFKIRDNLNFDKVLYFSLYKIYETEKYFYLYLTKDYSFIIDKNTFSRGNSQEFSIFIKNKMKFKYKNNMQNSAKN